MKKTTNWMKKIATAMLVGIGMLAFAAETPVLKITKVQQRYPWNGLVDIDVTVKGLGTPPLYFTATEKDTGRSLAVTKLTYNGVPFPNGRVLFPEGDYRIVWNAAEDVGEGYVHSNVMITVSNKLDRSPWGEIVIDLSEGSSANTYPVERKSCGTMDYISTFFLTRGEEFKTTRLRLLVIPAGSFMMQGNRPVTLTQPFYMGVFEVTQKQYELVMGSNPSSYKGDARPVETVSWNKAMDFCAVLSQKTGLNFTLPTEAQWEYACRAGTTTDFNNGTDSIAGLGRYDGNRRDGIGGYSDAHTTVGSYLPNAWGLYDMHGNVWEWCADWYGLLGTTAVTNPMGVDGGDYSRVQRGGGWGDGGSRCMSSSRYGASPYSKDYFYGFRVVCTSGL